jgi:hypothetical protein
VSRTTTAPLRACCCLKKRWTAPLPSITSSDAQQVTWSRIPALVDRPGREGDEPATAHQP